MMIAETPELFFSRGKARPPVRYHGGKWALAPWIVSHFPEHGQYVEPFGGGASVLMRKPRSKVEIYNDLDEDVVNFFRVLRTPRHRAKLISAVALCPFSRSEFEAAYEPSDDPVEKAFRLTVRSWAGFGAHSFNIKNSNGFRTRDKSADKSYAKEWAGIPDALTLAAGRLRGVTIERLPASRIIPMYDHAETLFYLDPPYPMALRDTGGKGYAHELSDHDHRTLAFILQSIKGRAIISGYACDLYDRQLFSNWHRVEKRAYANGHSGRSERTEVLWMNFQPPATALQTPEPGHCKTGQAIARPRSFGTDVSICPDSPV